MTENSMQPHLHLSKVHRFCILCGNPDRVSKISKFLVDSVNVAKNRGLIAYEGKTPDGKIPISVLTTGMGCPSTAIIVEEAFRAGGEFFIRIGSCGALKPSLKIGDIIIPYAAVRDEYTSLNLAPKEFPAVASPEMFQQLCHSAEKLGFNYHPGIVWTTDIYYSSVQDLFQKWANCGANSVEMESGFLFIFGSVKKVKTGTILVVDGNLATGTQKSEGSLGDVDSIFQQGEEAVIKITLQAIDELA
ncbi:MAG: nucleoside phosphorylase [Candidatus Hodarchaeota archaeon]